jgi:inorganic pyrophosphatase
MMPGAKLARMLSDELPLGHFLSADPGAGEVPTSDFRASSDKERDARPMNWGICCDHVKETVSPYRVGELDVTGDAPIHVLHARVTLLEGKFTDLEFHGWRNAKGPKRIDAQILMVNVNSLVWENVSEIPHFQSLTKEQHRHWFDILHNAHQGDTDKVKFYYNQLLRESERTRPAGFQTPS